MTKQEIEEIEKRGKIDELLSVASKKISGAKNALENIQKENWHNTDDRIRNKLRLTFTRIPLILYQLN